MPPPILISTSDFLKIRKAQGLYVDKSDFIVEVLRRPAEAQLYPRPRRFGKTTSMSALRYFLEKGEDRSSFFSDLKVWQDPLCRKHFQKYAVINLSFKDVKPQRWEEMKVQLEDVVRDELRRHMPGLRTAGIDPALVGMLDAASSGDVRPRILVNLCEALYAATGENVVLLIDEYDAPLLHAWTRGYYDEVASWFRAFLTAGLKDNSYLYRGVLTGILRVAKESMFSGLNNVQVYSLLSKKEELFGFTEAEVADLLQLYGREAEAEEIRAWYNGYRFGGRTVYNPWSILSVLGSPEEDLGPHWLNTSDNAMVRELLLKEADLQPAITTLLAGGSIERSVDENVVLRDLTGDHIWSFLLFSGYLKALSFREDQGRTLAELGIPNREVTKLWQNTFVRWLETAAGQIEPLHQAILAGAAEKVEQILSKMLLRHVSQHDVTMTQSEAFYHAFVLGLLVSMERTHFVRSNREVGKGRADVQIIPKQPGQPGVVLEFKRQDDKRSLFAHAGAALRQIQQKGYCTELESAGATPIHRLGISFAGKDVSVRGG